MKKEVKKLLNMNDKKTRKIFSTVIIVLVVLAMVLARVFHMGPIAVWIGMFTDWTIRAIIYTVRFRNRKWLAHQVI